MHSVTALRLTVLVCLLALTACAAQQRHVNALAEKLDVNGADQTLLELEKFKPKTRDKAQYLLNRGILKHFAGDPSGSITDLQSAKKIMDSLQAISISENIGASTVNDTLRSYSGTPGERVLLHQLLAYNYLQQGDLDGARVEMLQADVTMRQVAKSDSLRGQLASTHFLSGIIYELNREWDNAMISYRHASEIMKERRQKLPLALQDSLLQLSKRQGLTDEYKRYTKRFGRQARTFDAGDRELLVLYADGVVSNKRQHFISVFSIERKQNISISIPYYPPANYRPQHYHLQVAGKYHRTQRLESIEQVARQDFADELPRITATTLARVVAKFLAADEARKKQGDLAGILVNIAGSVSEQADLRSWNMLPSTLQTSRIVIPKGLTVSGADLPHGLNSKGVISFEHTSTLLLIASSVSR